MTEIDKVAGLREQDRSQPMRILVVEDERKMASFICKSLQTEGYAVQVLHHGDLVMAAVSATAFDVVLLDIMLPGRDGLSLVRQMRAGGIQTPVMLLTARSQINERVDGLDAGADDYLPKPFALAELNARVRALGRRSKDNGAVKLTVGDLVCDTVTRTVQRGGRAIDLAPREYRLLEFLMRSQGRVCSRMMIVEKVWEYDFDPGSNLVDVYVKRLREKIDDGAEVKLLHTVRGAGYVLREGP